MARPDKAATVEALTERFRGSTAAVLTEYRGLTVAQLRELRRALGADTSFSVVKNTLTKIAARNAGITDLEPLLEGPSAVAFVSGDPVAAAKGLRDFARAHPLLVIKGGVVEGRGMSADDVRRLADLESREVLLARLAGGMTASLSRAAALFQAPLAQAARLAEALRAKVEEQGGPAAAGAASAAAPPAGFEGTDAGPAGSEGTDAGPAGSEGGPAAADAPGPAPDASADAPGPA